MGMANAGAITANLIAGGRAPATPAIAIAQATLPEQRTCRARLDQLADVIAAAGLASPALMIIGEVARAAESALVAQARRMSVAA